MGNLQQQCRGIFHGDRVTLDRSQAIYHPNEIISGTVICHKGVETTLILVGTISYEKRRKSRLEKCRIHFLSMEFHLNSSTNDEDPFEFHLDDQLPPSFQTKRRVPYLSYSINLMAKNSPDRILCSIPIWISPRVTIDRPLLSRPLFFGPVENHHSAMKLDIKVNRAVFTANDLIEIFYELQNPREIFINRIEITLGIYYSINCQVYQENLSNAFETYRYRSGKRKLIRNKALLDIPQKIPLPPTFKFQYGHESDRSSFNLTIDYKIQFQVHFHDEGNLWQVDIPILLASEKLDNSTAMTENEQSPLECVE